MVDTLGLEPSALTGVRVRLSYPLLHKENARNAGSIPADLLVGLELLVGQCSSMGERSFI